MALGEPPLLVYSELAGFHASDFSEGLVRFDHGLVVDECRIESVADVTEFEQVVVVAGGYQAIGANLHEDSEIQSQGGCSAMAIDEPQLHSLRGKGQVVFLREVEEDLVALIAMIGFLADPGLRRMGDGEAAIFETVDDFLSREELIPPARRGVSGFCESRLN